MIEMQGVSKQFDGKKILENITVTVNPGERLGIIGPGGCGKTLLIKILLGLISPDKGKVHVLGVDMDKGTSSEQNRMRKQVGMAFQQGGLFDFMTVQENLLFAMSQMTSMTAGEMQETVERLLAAVKLPHVQSMYPYELSGGMQRRVGIVRALCTQPRVAIFDEPTSGLDPVTSTIILNMILALGTHTGHDPSLLVVTSNVETAIRFSDRILVLHEGHVVADGPWRTLMMEGSDWVRHFLQVRFIGLDRAYVKGLGLPPAFIEAHWKTIWIS